MPTPCPSRLKELIALANLEPESEARKHLQAIARAFKAKRQQKRDAPASLQIKLRQTITVHLSDGTVETPRDELELALAEVDPPNKLDLVRECPRCLEIFWAGRTDKEACDRHMASWSKQEWRRKTKEKEAKRAKDRARRKESRVDKPLRVSRTTAAILGALANRCRFWKSIDDHCYFLLRATRRHEGKYRTATVKRCLKMLLDLGFVTCDDTTVKNPYYAPTEKINRYYREGLFIFEEENEPPKH